MKMTSNNVKSILEIIKTTYPLRTATVKTCWEICCIHQCFPHSTPFNLYIVAAL